MSNPISNPMSQPGTDKELQIDAELNHACALAEYCRDLLGKLEGRLTRVLVDIPINPIEGKDRALCALASQMANINAILLDNNTRIQHIVDRLQL